MNPSIIRFSIDLQKYDRFFVVNVKQGSSNTKLIISILDNGKPYIFEDGVSVDFLQTTQSGRQISASCDVVDNQIILELPKDSTFEAGTSDCEFSFIDGGGNGITPYIELAVHASLMHEYASNAVQSDSFELLTTTIASSREAIIKMEDATKDAKDLKAEIEEKVTNGEFNGKSAYEIAQKNGYEGTEKEWVLSTNAKVDGNTLILPHILLKG